ncbi:MAG: hypothetical protein ABI175_01165 [Polyangiales bacterium]
MKRAHLAGLILGVVTAFAAYDVAYAQSPEDFAEKPEEKKEEPSMLKTLAAIGLASIGVIITFIPASKTFTSNSSYAQSKLSMINLLRTNPHQAEFMAKKMEGTYCEAIAAALKIGATAGTNDLTVIRSATAPTYDGVAQGVAGKWKGDAGKAKVGLMAAIAGAGIGLAGASLVFIPIILAALAISAFLRLLWFAHDLNSQILRARAEVLPEVDAAIASGRYRAPPKAM